MEWVYEECKENNCRFILGPKSKNPLLCIGINPSTATPSKLDNTMKSVERIARYNGFDGYIMLNVYPRKSTNPNGLDIARDPDIISQNLYWIEKILKEYREPTVWAAWGALINKRNYLKHDLRVIFDISKGNNVRWVKAESSNPIGHPHHPLYLKKNERLQPFDIDEYYSTWF